MSEIHKTTKTTGQHSRVTKCNRQLNMAEEHISQNIVKKQQR